MNACCNDLKGETRGGMPEPTSTACRFIRDHASDLVRAYFRKRVNHADADDLTQETVIKAWLNCNTLHHPEKVSAWVWGIARRQLVQHYRSEGRVKNVEFDEAFETEAASNRARTTESFRSDLLDFIKACDGSFSGDQREILERMLSGESQVDVAKAVNVPVSTIRTRAQRAREKVRALAEQRCFLKRDAYNRVIGCEPVFAPPRIALSQTRPAKIAVSNGGP